MSFIGNAPAAIPTSFQTVQADSFNGTGSAVNFTLSRQITNLYDIEVLVDNVQQSPYDGSYSVSGTTLTFSSAPSSGTNNIYVIYRDHPITSIAPRAQTIEVLSPGGGTSSLVAASSASDFTLTFPASTGTMMLTDTGVTTAQMPAGSVIQVVENNQTLARFSTSSTSFVDTGFFVNITPTSASNKILIGFNTTGLINGGGYAYYTIYRDSTDLSDWTNEGLVLGGYNTAGGVWFPVSATRIDSPASTSQLTYKLYIKSSAGYTSYAGRNTGTGTKNQVQLIAMEIAA